MKALRSVTLAWPLTLKNRAACRGIRASSRKRVGLRAMTPSLSVLVTVTRPLSRRPKGADA